MLWRHRRTVSPDKWRVQAALKFKTASATTRLDYLMVIPGTVVRILNASTGGSWSAYNYEAMDSTLIDSSGNVAAYNTVLGNPIELIPDRLNFLWAVLGDDGEAHTITETTTVVVFVTPRWLVA